MRNATHLTRLTLDHHHFVVTVAVASVAAVPTLNHRQSLRGPWSHNRLRKSLGVEAQVLYLRKKERKRLHTSRKVVISKVDTHSRRLGI